MRNPFDPFRPITNPNDFVGRQDVMNEIIRGASTSVSYAVIGGRRIGKTSLLNRLCSAMEQHNKMHAPLLVPVPLSLHCHTPTSRSSFFRSLLKNAQQRLANGRAGIRVPLNRCRVAARSEESFDLEEIIHVLNLLVDSTMEAAGDTSFFFLIDETEYLSGKPFAKDLLANLRHIIGANDLRGNVGFVFFGANYLYDVATCAGSPLENVLRIIHLGALRTAEARDLCHKAHDIGMRVSQPLTDSTYRMTNGHPMLMQYLLWRICERKAQPTEDAVCDACRDFKDKTRVFSHWLSGFSDREIALYRLLVARAKDGYFRASRTELRDALEFDGVSEAIDRLFCHGLVHRNEKKHVEGYVGLFADWIADRLSRSARGVAVRQERHSQSAESYPQTTRNHAVPDTESLDKTPGVIEAETGSHAFAAVPPFQLDWNEPRLVDANNRPLRLDPRCHNVLKGLLSKDWAGRRQRIVKGSLTYREVAVCYLYPKSPTDDDGIARIAHNFARSLRRHLKKRYGINDHAALIRRTTGGYEMGTAWHRTKPTIDRSAPTMIPRDHVSATSTDE